MRVGWLADRPDHTGGAELTQAEFRAAAPEDVEIIDCPPGEVAGCDRYVIHNCMQFTLDDLHQLEGKPVAKYHHDVGPWLQPQVWKWLEQHVTTHICCSPIQALMMDEGEGRPELPQRSLNAVCIPPAVDLARFEAAAATVNGDRDGTVSVGQWRNYGKAPQKVIEWTRGNGGVDFYGGGPFAPPGSREMAYEGMPALLARYRTFVFLPTVLEPFGRTVAEAWAAGCEIVTNGLVGARFWIEEDPEALFTAADDFWEVVCG